MLDIIDGPTAVVVHSIDNLGCIWMNIRVLRSTITSNLHKPLWYRLAAFDRIVGVTKAISIDIGIEGAHHALVDLTITIIIDPITYFYRTNIGSSARVVAIGRLVQSCPGMVPGLSAPSRPIVRVTVAITIQILVELLFDTGRSVLGAMDEQNGEHKERGTRTWRSGVEHLFTTLKMFEGLFCDEGVIPEH